MSNLKVIALAVGSSACVSIGAVFSLAFLFQQQRDRRDLVLDAPPLESSSDALERLEERIQLLESAAPRESALPSAQLGNSPANRDAKESVLELSKRIEALENSRRASAEGDGGVSTDAELSSEELTLLVEDALRKQAEAKRNQKIESLRPKFDRQAESSGKEASDFLRSIADTIGVEEWQIEEVARITEESTREYLLADAAGASEQELHKIEREAHLEAQAVMGVDSYRRMRVEEHSLESRGKVDWVANYLDADEGQASLLQQEFRRYSEDSVDDRIRLDTVELSEEERDQIERELEEGDEATWGRAISENLSEEQQRRFEALVAGSK